MSQPGATLLTSQAAPPWRLMVTGLAGNVMEWYDFAVYGYLAPVIGRHFFPSQDAVASLMAAFGAFAAGFLMRPLGGLLFGHLGDRLGRQAALTTSVLAMAVPTFCIGVLPDYARLGAAASVLIVVFRLVQGLSVGGEYAISAVFLVEGARPDRRGLMGSWGAFGAVAGILLGSAVGALINSVLSADAVDAWGWRLPFLLGLGVGLAGLYLRRHLPEPPLHPATEGPTTVPVVEAFRTQWRTMLQVAGVTVLTGAGFWLLFVYVATYLQQIVHIQAAQAFDINTLSMGLLLLVMPAAGALSDQAGRKPLLLASALGTLLLAWPLFWLLHHPDARLILLGQMGFAVLIGVFCGVIPAAIVEVFPARVRCSALAISYNVCLGVIGGMTPLVVTYLIARSHDDLAPAYYLMAAAAIALGVLLGWRETAQAPLR